MIYLLLEEWKICLVSLEIEMKVCKKETQKKRWKMKWKRSEKEFWIQQNKKGLWLNFISEKGCWIDLEIIGCCMELLWSFMVMFSVIWCSPFLVFPPQFPNYFHTFNLSPITTLKSPLDHYVLHCWVLSESKSQS